MSNQIFKLRALPGVTVTLSVHNQPNSGSALAGSDESESTENRVRVECNKRTSTIRDSIMHTSAFKANGFRLADVISNTSEASGAVRLARDFITRADGSSCSVLFMNAETQEAKNRVSTKLVAIKFVRGNGTGSAASAQAEDAVLKHENAVIQYLKVKKVPNVIRPLKDGIFSIPGSNRSLLIMEHANCGEEDRDLLPNISLYELISMMSQLASTLQAVHESKVTHGNICSDSIFFDSIDKLTTLGHWKHGRFAENRPPEYLPSLSKFLVVEDGKLAIEEVRNPEDRYRKDASDFASVGMALMSRNSCIDVLSFVGKDIDQTLQDLTDTFNKYVCDENQLLCISHPLAEVIKGLLTGQKDLAETFALLSENQQALHKFSGPTSVPGIYVAEEREMLFPVDLLSVEGTDEKGNQSIGIGAFAAVDTPPKSLVAKYLSHKVRRAYAERLRSRGKGCHLISWGKGRRIILDGARECNGVFDHHFMVEHVEVSFISILCDQFIVTIFHSKRLLKSCCCKLCDRLAPSLMAPIQSRSQKASLKTNDTFRSVSSIQIANSYTKRGNRSTYRTTLGILLRQRLFWSNLYVL